MIDLDAGKINLKGGIADSLVYQHQRAKALFVPPSELHTCADSHTATKHHDKRFQDENTCRGKWILNRRQCEEILQNLA